MAKMGRDIAALRRRVRTLEALVRRPVVVVVKVDESFADDSSASQKKRMRESILEAVQMGEDAD